MSRTNQTTYPYFLLSMYHFKDHRYAGTFHVISESEEGFEPDEETKEKYPGEFMIDRVIGRIRETDSLKLNTPFDYVEHTDGASVEELSCVAE